MLASTQASYILSAHSFYNIEDKTTNLQMCYMYFAICKVYKFHKSGSCRTDAVNLLLLDIVSS